MTVRDDEIIDILTKEDEGFKNLVSEHRNLDNKIQQLDSKIYLLPDEKMERKKLSKIKLSKKDEIARIVSEYRKKSG